ncbi:MAG: MaoC family dehydratase N-terminal domain-containing protein [Halioglobus sp.]|nr:MaoC family dehydratase N-terminal domain-containing protein [Halioglobus sp.]
MKYFEDYWPDQRSESPRCHTVTAEEIIEFGTRWDYQPFHVDPQAAKATPFGGLVASSTQLFAIAVGLWCHADVPTQSRSVAISALGFNNMRLQSPARPGDVLRGESVVKEKRLSQSHPEAGILVMHNKVLNQRDEVVFGYEHAALYRRRLEQT